MPDGTLVGDHLTVLGWQIRTGGLQGVLTNRDLVDEHGIETLDQIVNDPELFAIFDAGDSTPATASSSCWDAPRVGGAI